MASELTSLHDAVERLDDKQLLQLINDGASIDAKDAKAQTALHLAAKKSATDLVSRLLEQGANHELLDHKGRTPLELAVTHKASGFDNITQAFIDHNAKCDANLLVVVASYNLPAAVDSVEHLCRLGADVNAQDDTGRTVFHYAALDSPAEMVVTLLEFGANTDLTDREGKIALQYATKLESAEKIKRLFELGRTSDAIDSHSDTNFIVRAGAKSILKPLVRLGADVNATDGVGRTALHLAICAIGAEETETLDAQSEGPHDDDSLSQAHQLFADQGLEMISHFGSGILDNPGAYDNAFALYKKSKSASASESYEGPFGHWPRRLLHLRSMKSLQWGKGNSYGLEDGLDYREPQYNIVSYTWGRFRSKQGQTRIAGHLMVDRVRWTLPSLDLHCFPLHEFNLAIEKIRDYNPHIEFLWLDIACIDQTRNSREGGLEIGRQAKIFEGAKNSYIWLSTLSSDDWIGLLKNYPITGDTFKQILEPLEILKRILSDPWFTSLWTLQEAFLRKDAYILDSVGSIVQGLRHRSSFTVLLDSCEQLERCLLRIQILPGEQSQVMKGLEMLNRSGVLSIRKRYPIAMYFASTHRTATNSQDYIYGIQQIFSLRLGKTAPRLFREAYSLNDLEEQMGIFLLRKYPVESQLHVFADPESRSAWHIDRSSWLPRGANFDHHFKFDRPHHCKCEISLFSSNGRLIGLFSGWAKLRDDRIKKAQNMMVLILGKIEIGRHDGPSSSAVVDDSPSSSDESGDTFYSDDSDDERYSYCGMILKAVGRDRWKRLGICAWTPKFRRGFDKAKWVEKHKFL